MKKPTEEQIAEWKVVRKEWVEALRSGKYEQGKGQLVKDGKYCCLGVLCEVIGMKKSKGTNHAFTYYGDEYQLAPYTALRAVGLNDQHGSYDYTDEGLDEGIALTERNDAGESFDEIADIIEKEPLGLFKESKS